VAKAWGSNEAGRPVASAGHHHAALSIDWTMQPPGAVLETSVDTIALVPPDLVDLDAIMIRDELLGVSVVHVEAERPDAVLGAILDEVMRRLVAGTTAAELVTALSPA
jgi:hypothetical protein